VFRATAGQPDQAQIMYGIAGKRRLRPLPGMAPYRELK
jgi:hypothetical protein